MFLCGNDADAKKVVTGLVAGLGFEPVDAGPLTQARYLEPLAMLWISMAYGLGQGPNFGVPRAATVSVTSRGSHNSVSATNVTNPAIAGDKPPRAAASSAHTIVCTRHRRSAVGAGQRRSKLPLSDGGRKGELWSK
jgi:hypothetical protein